MLRRSSPDLKDALDAHIQAFYTGTTALYTSAGAIANGSSAIRAIAPTTMPSADQIVGVALNRTTGADQQVRVLTSGFGTAARTTTYAAPSEVKLDSTTSGQTSTDSQVLFRDSGGLPGSYAANENYQCVFDAGVAQTWSIQFVTTPTTLRHSSRSNTRPRRCTTGLGCKSAPMALPGLTSASPGCSACTLVHLVCRQQLELEQ